jgi:hypothetical protein
MRKTSSATWRRVAAVLVALGASVASIGCGTTQTTRVDHVAELEAVLTGSFSSAAQAAADPDFLDIRLHAVSLNWPGPGRHVYIEQAMASAMERPYRQRVYRLSEREGGVLVSEVYEIRDPLRFAGSWKDPSKLAALTLADLEWKMGCAVELRREGPGVFRGGTVGQGCPSSLRGASYAVSEVFASPEGLRTWDRGYDAAGAQVWGATKGAYEFRREP